MNKWFKFFFTGFFSHKSAKDGVKHGYTSVFLAFTLALVFLWAGFVLGEMLPFGAQYRNSPDFAELVQNVLANTDDAKRIDARIESGDLLLKKHGCEYTEGLLVNTFEREGDRQEYSVNGYNVVIDTRPAGTLAEIDAYCVSNDGKGTEISYSDYLTLSDVARLNFDFRIRYTGNELVLSDETVAEYFAYLGEYSAEKKGKAEKLASDLSSGVITKEEYNRAVYELYFESYYPSIKEYENTSKVPLLRNYYYHRYISQGAEKYLFIFDDYMAGSFETKGGIDVRFYGFFSKLDDGPIVEDGATEMEAEESVDRFVKSSYRENWILNAYAYMINVITLVPFIALMLMVATLLAYSVLRLKGAQSVVTLGMMLRIVGTFVWFSGLVSAAVTVICMFFVRRSLISALPVVLFFITLVIRSIIFALQEAKLDKHRRETQEAGQTEV